MERFEKKWHRSKHFFAGYSFVKSYNDYRASKKRTKDLPEDKTVQRLLKEIYVGRHEKC